MPLTSPGSVQLNEVNDAIKPIPLNHIFIHRPVTNAEQCDVNNVPTCHAGLFT